MQAMKCKRQWKPEGICGRWSGMCCAAAGTGTGRKPGGQRQQVLVGRWLRYLMTTPAFVWVVILFGGQDAEQW